MQASGRVNSRGESRDEPDDIDSGPSGESILINGGLTHPELISCVDCGLVEGSSSSSESDNVRSITSTLAFLAAGDGPGESES